MRQNGPPDVAKFAAGLAAGFVVGLSASTVRKLAVQGLEAKAGDWLDILMAEHRAVDLLFAKLEETTNRQPLKRAALFNKIKLALSKHAFQEENVVYPALGATDPARVAKKLNDEHFEIKSLLSEAQQTPADLTLFTDLMQRLRKVILAHVKEEEEVLFPALRERMTPQKNAELTARMMHEGMKLS